MGKKGEGGMWHQHQEEHLVPPATLRHRVPHPLAPVISGTSENLTSAREVPETAAVAWYGHVYLTDLSYLLRWNCLLDYTHRQQDFRTLTML